MWLRLLCQARSARPLAGGSYALQQGGHVFSAEACFYGGLAEPFEDDEADLAGLIFFVVLHVGKPGIDCKLRRGNGQSGGLQQADDALGVGGFQVAFALGQAGGKHHAGGYGFAVQPVAVAHLGFYGVAEGVAEVKESADALLFFILLDDAGFHLAAVADGVGKGGGLLPHDAGHGVLEFDKEIHVAEQGVFDDFSQAGGKFARGKGLQDGGIGDDGLGLVKRADHVFAERVVDAGFAAHGGIDLAEQGGGDLDEGDAALVGGGGKTGQIADYAAAEGEDGGVAVGMVLQQAGVDLLEGFAVFVLFAVGQDDVATIDAELSAGCFDGGKIKRGNGLIADDGGFAGDMWADEFGQVAEQA